MMYIQEELEQLNIYIKLKKDSVNKPVKISHFFVGLYHICNISLTLAQNNIVFGI